MKLYDAIGEEILPGCWVLYPVREGGAISMKRMNVVDTSGGKITGYRTDGRRVVIRHVENCVVVEPRDVQDADLFGVL